MKQRATQVVSSHTFPATESATTLIDMWLPPSPTSGVSRLAMTACNGLSNTDPPRISGDPRTSLLAHSTLRIGFADISNRTRVRPPMIEPRHIRIHEAEWLQTPLHRPLRRGVQRSSWLADNEKPLELSESLRPRQADGTLSRVSGHETVGDEVSNWVVQLRPHFTVERTNRRLATLDWKRT